MAGTSPKMKKSPDKPSAYYPLCMLSIAGKVLDRIIYISIEEISEYDLTDWQYRFQKERSTFNIINSIIYTASKAIPVRDKQMVRKSITC